MSLTDSALSARNVIVAAVTILAISLLWAWADILAPNDSGGAARDSYGTRADGYRALYELLEELGVATSRSSAPPTQDLPTDATLVMLAPQQRLVRTAPRHLHEVLEWVEQGGRLVVAPAVRQSSWQQKVEETEDLVGAPRDVLDAIGVGDRVGLEERRYLDLAQFQEQEEESLVDESSQDDEEEYDYLPENLRRAFKKEALPVERVPIAGTGDLQSVAHASEEIALPAEKLSLLTGDLETLDGSLVAELDEETTLPLAAAIRRGRGEIIVVSEPLLFTNALLSQAGNSVVAARLLTDNGANQVIFDEFYHGLAVRGNPFYLFTYVPFATIVLTVLGGVVVWAWRAATFLGPPLATRDVSRRTVGEYVEAMSRFLSGGQGARRFIAEEMRDGVLREFCRRLQLPLETPDSDRIVAKVELRDPRNATALSQALAEVDQKLAAGDDYPSSKILPDVKRLAACLSKSSIA